MFTMFENMYKHIKKSTRYKKTIDELSKLTDRELSDIGISRCDIPRIAKEVM